ncbi:MAG: hypothetical protein WCV00_03525 [Verrucomicrobiia bacterium]
MSTPNVREQLEDSIKDCTSIPEAVDRLQKKGVILRPYSIDVLFGKGVSTALAELVRAVSDGSIFVRDVHGSTCMLVVYRTGDLMYLQGEFSIMTPGS